MADFNWFDILIIVLLLLGMAIGYSQGLIRQLIGLAAVYVALILATQFFRALSQGLAGLLRVPPNTLSNMLAFFALFLLALTIINFLAQDAYKSTRIRILPFLDHISGMFLGVISMWLIISILVSVMTFAVGTQTWLQGESTRQFLLNGLSNSRVAPLTESALSFVLVTLQPWLPGGLPALFSF
jgi:uncharacterized membrane protein required for colicin V production